MTTTLTDKELKRQRRTCTGQQIAEMMGGLLILVPIVLFLIDLGIIVNCSQLADKIAKAAARAAANQGSAADAKTAADSALATFSGSLGFASNLKLDDSFGTNGVNYVPIDPADQTNKNKGLVQVQIKMDVTVPVPIPGVFPSPKQFVARDTEPVVCLPTGS